MDEGAEDLVSRMVGFGWLLDVTPTAALAIYGAAVSTFTLILTVVRDRRSSATVKLSVYLGREKLGYVLPFGADIGPKDPNASPPSPAAAFFAFSVTNTGGQPVTILDIGGGFKQPWYRRDRVRPSFVIDRPPILQLPPGTAPVSPATSLPLMLPAFNGHMVARSTERVTRESVESIAYFFARDSTGRMWKTPRSGMRALRRQVNRYLP